MTEDEARQKPAQKEWRVPVPVTIVAGFLGSGKTTLLNRVLADARRMNVAVLVNDFGAINIDSRLIVDRNATMITLENGCVCCSITGDLVSQLTALLEGPAALHHVLVETSGVSDPGRILVALRDRHLRRLARVDGVVTLVDAAGISEIPPAHTELARRQLAAADVIVFNKTDLVTADELTALHGRLTYPRARVVDTVNARVSLDVLLGSGRPSDQNQQEPDAPARHVADFATWSWTSTHPLDPSSIRNVLLNLPSAVYRAKGFLHLAGDPTSRIVAHVVGRRVDMRPIGGWGGDRPRSELVFISLDSEIDIVALREALASTAAPRVMSVLTE